VDFTVKKSIFLISANLRIGPIVIDFFLYSKNRTSLWHLFILKNKEKKEHFMQEIQTLNGSQKGI
jgi:hypothetical protein